MADSIIGGASAPLTPLSAPAQTGAMSGPTIAGRFTPEQIAALIDEFASSARVISEFAVKCANDSVVNPIEAADGFYIIERLANHVGMLADWAGGWNINHNPAQWICGGTAFENTGRGL